MISEQKLVFDNGSYSIKAGFAEEEAPKAEILSVTGKSKIPNINMKTTYIGDEALIKKFSLDLKYPIDRGVVNDWESMEEMWKYCFFEELKVLPNEHSVFLTEPSLNPKEKRARMIEIFFENFNIPNYYVSSSAEPALYASGRTLGTVLNSGDGITEVVPICEGGKETSSIIKNEFAGKDITIFLSKSLIKNGYQNVPHEIVQDIKEKVCYLSINQENDLEKISTYELPDGKLLNIGFDIANCPEILFNPNTNNFDRDNSGLHQLLFESIVKCDICTRRYYYENIILAGGNTLFPNFKEKLENKLKKIAPSSFKINVIGGSERKYRTWIGSSILASLNSFESLWIKKEEYLEFGSLILDKKCN